jgi:hypothetical protein
LADVASPRNTAVATEDVTFSEPIDLGTFDFHDLTLTRDGVNIPLTGTVTIAPVSDSTYRISGLDAFTAPLGTYVLTVSAVGVQNLAGNTGTASLSASWTVTNVTTPTTTITLTASPGSTSTYGQILSFTATVSPADSGGATPQGTIQFEVDGIDFGPALTLVNGSATSGSLSGLAAGGHTITAIYSGDPTYSTNTQTLNQTVNPAPLTITADNQSKVHGAANPPLTYTVSGFVNGDTTASFTTPPTLSTTATASSGVGSYSIIISGAVAPNYSITYVNGTLTINPYIEVTTTADDGDNSNPTAGSLRAAIILANSIPGSTIHFQIGSGPQTIGLAAPLPAIAAPVTIDGTSQPGYAGTLLITVDGTGAGGQADGLDFAASSGGSTIEGLDITHFSGNGIALSGGSGITVTTNVIVGNGGDGVTLIGSSHDMIGGTAPGAGNVIAHNLGNGVTVGLNVLDAALDDGILGNAIYSNGKLGIDLGNDGPTANTPGGPHSGPNDLQNTPVLTGASSSGNVTVLGTLNAAPNTTFRIEFFANAAGTGQGQTYLGSLSVTTDANGNAALNFATDLAALGQAITATATDPNGNTSEFSAAQAVQPLQSVPGSLISVQRGPHLQPRQPPLLADRDDHQHQRRRDQRADRPGARPVPDECHPRQ